MCKRTPDPARCHLCGQSGRLLDRSEILRCPPEDCPEPVLPPHLVPVYNAHSQLGVDAAGKPTVQEQILWLDLYGVRSPDERRVWVGLWRTITGAKLAEAQRRLDDLRRDA